MDSNTFSVINYLDDWAEEVPSLGLVYPTAKTFYSS